MPKHSGLGKGLLRSRMIDGNQGEGIVMHPEDFRASEAIRGFHGIHHPHGEVIADAEYREFQGT